LIKPINFECLALDKIEQGIFILLKKQDYCHPHCIEEHNSKQATAGRFQQGSASKQEEERRLWRIKIKKQERQIPLIRIGL